MTKIELVKQLAEQAGFLSVSAAGRAYDSLISIIEGQLAQGNKVALGNNIGTLVVAHTAGKVSTLNGVTYPAVPKKVVKFKASKALKAVVAG